MRVRLHAEPSRRPPTCRPRGHSPGRAWPPLLYLCTQEPRVQGCCARESRRLAPLCPPGSWQRWGLLPCEGRMVPRGLRRSPFPLPLTHVDSAAIGTGAQLSPGRLLPFLWVDAGRRELTRAAAAGLAGVQEPPRWARVRFTTAHTPLLPHPCPSCCDSACHRGVDLSP